jgi:hypothetical protein
MGLARNSERESASWIVVVRVGSDAGVAVDCHVVSPSAKVVVWCFWVALTAVDGKLGAR